MATALLLAACGKSSETTSAAGSSPPSTAAPTSSPSAAPLSSPLDGAWKTTITAKDLRDAGASPAQSSGVIGTYLTNLAYGAISQTVTNGVTIDAFSGSYTVEGDRLSLTDQSGTMTFSFVLEGNQLSLRLLDDSLTGMDRTIDEVVWTSHPWKKTS